MSHRFFPSMCPLTAAFLVLSLAVSAVGQGTWTPRRTADGQPDLEGTWTNPTITPFERPVELAGKEFVTEQEAAQLEEQAALNNVDRPPGPGQVGSYNRFWFDSGTEVVSTRRTSLVIDPPDGRVPVKPEAETRRVYALEHIGDSWEYMSPWDRCIMRGVPGGMFPAGYNNYYRFLQTPDTVVIHYEMIHEARIIPLDGRPRLGEGSGSWNGESRGRWEGDTLVVETRGYIDGGWIATSGSQRRIKGIPHTSQLHVVEHFTRTGPDTILWRATIEDPEIYTAPWTVEIPLVSRRGSRIYEYACHEGNQAVRNILRGARVQESDP